MTGELKSGLMDNNPIHRLPATDPKTKLTNAIVDTPGGSRCKYKFDEAAGMFRLGKILPAGMCFPYDFGSIPGTLAEDGDALDVLILSDAPTYVGCLVRVRILGALEARQSEGRRTIRNDRLLAVPVTEYNKPAEHSIEDIPPVLLTGIEHFFISYNEAQGRRFTPIARSGAKRAMQLIATAEAAFQKPRKK